MIKSNQPKSEQAAYTKRITLLFIGGLLGCLLIYTPGLVLMCLTMLGINLISIKRLIVKSKGKGYGYLPLIIAALLLMTSPLFMANTYWLGLIFVMPFIYITYVVATGLVLLQHYRWSNGRLAALKNTKFSEKYKLDLSIIALLIVTLLGYDLYLGGNINYYSKLSYCGHKPIAKIGTNLFGVDDTKEVVVGLWPSILKERNLKCSMSDKANLQ